MVNAGTREPGEVVASAGETDAAGELDGALPPHATPRRINSDAPPVTRGNVGREKKCGRLSMLARSLDGPAVGSVPGSLTRWGRAAETSAALPN